jgi:hypothetical protein
MRVARLTSKRQPRRRLERRQRHAGRQAAPRARARARAGRRGASHRPVRGVWFHLQGRGPRAGATDGRWHHVDPQAAEQRPGKHPPLLRVQLPAGAPPPRISPAPRRRAGFGAPRGGRPGPHPLPSVSTSAMSFSTSSAGTCRGGSAEVRRTLLRRRPGGTRGAVRYGRSPLRVQSVTGVTEGAAGCG